MPLALVIGGTRSGKSELAEQMAGESLSPVTYVATGRAGDGEMAERIAAHRARRPPEWRTVETSDPLETLRAADGRTVLIDSLGGWVTALMEDLGLLTDLPVSELGAAGHRANSEAVARVRALAAAASARPALTVVVAEEAGLGPAALGASTRRYLDLAGEAAQVLSAAAAQVLLVVAGRAVELTSRPTAADAPELRLHGDSMVPPQAEDFAVNVERGPRPRWLDDALAEALAGAGEYPDEHRAVAAVAHRHGRSPEEVVLTNGASEAIWVLAAAVRSRRAVCVHPSFTEPEAALRAHRHRVERCFRRPDDFILDPATVPSGADLVVTGNPNNPSGTLDPAAHVAALARPGRVLVVDEAFMDFVPGEPESLASRGDLPGLVVVRSLTKLWSLAGIRAGYLLAPARIAAAIRRLRPPWSANALALAALRACASRADAGREAAERAVRAREHLRAGLGRLRGVRTWPSATNFLLARVPDGRRVHEGLLTRGIAVRPAVTFPGLTADHLRITARQPAANERLCAAVAEALG
jgi:histidinol-phosphate/aromatic aminotransferase/cobyric acid decarboxylase-like protein/adenosyl cobinamide kinase/adenosyl cobinamide phosphate guanylyltransferase